MATVQQLVSDLKHLGNFLDLQRSTVSPDLWESMLRSHMDTWQHRLDALSSMSPEEATELAQAVAASPFPDQAKSELSDHLSKALKRLSKTKGKKKVENQEIPHFINYLSRSDRLVLGDTTLTTLEKIDQLVSRCVKLGLLWPSEESVGHVISAGVAAGLPADDRPEYYSVSRCVKLGLLWPSEESVGHVISAGVAAGLPADDRPEYYSRVSKFKSVLHKKRENLHLPVILKQYPDFPADLPDEMKECAGYDQDPPEPIARKDLQKAETIKTLRKSHSSITGPKESDQLQLATMPLMGKAAGMPAPMGRFLQEGVQMMGRMMMHYMQQQATAAPDINLQFMGHNSAGVGSSMPQVQGLQGQQSAQVQSFQAKSPGPSVQTLQLQSQSQQSPGPILQLQNQPQQQPEQLPSTSTAASNNLVQVPQVEPETSVPPPADQLHGENDEPSPSQVADWTSKDKPGRMKRPASAPVMKKPAACTKKTAQPKKVKPSTIQVAKRGWKVETRFRDDNSTDKYYIAPDSKRFRTKGQAEAYGFMG
eukprot:s1148_g24.t1